jgi:hypothetical protein
MMGGCALIVNTLIVTSAGICQPLGSSTPSGFPVSTGAAFSGEDDRLVLGDSNRYPFA